MDRFNKAEKNRNAILAYANRFAEKTISHRTASLALNIPSDVAYRCCRAMERDGEMEAFGKALTLRFRAKVEKTLSAKEMRERAINKIVEGNKKHQSNKKTEPWRYVHSQHRNLEEVSPLKGQGGQGAIRSRVYIGSCAGYV